jgi:hypothetical protein
MMPDKTLWSILAVLKSHQHNDARQNLLQQFGCYDINHHNDARQNLLEHFGCFENTST